MSAPGKTPIRLYNSATSGNVPLAINLAQGELALNSADGLLFYNDAGTVKTLGGSGGVTTFSGGTTGLTPGSATAGAITLAGTLAIANGGTNGTATPTANAVAYGSGTAYQFTAAPTVTGSALIYNGTNLSWSAAPVGQTTNALTAGTGLNTTPAATTFNGSAAVTFKLADTAVTPGSYGSSTTIPVITVDQQGRITLASSAATIDLAYQGTWNATTNSPALADGTGTQGDYYVCNVAGTQDLGSGPLVFNVGDWAIYSGTVWQQVLNSQTTSVANFTITGITANQILLGGGTSPIYGGGFGTAGQILTSTGAGTAPTWNTNFAGNAATVTNGVYTTDTGTVTNTMLAGSIVNGKLQNSSVTVNGSSVSLGGSITVTANTTNAVTFDTTGGAASGTTFNGSAARTVDYSTVGAAPAAGSSSIVTVGTITSGTWNGTAVDVAHGGTNGTATPTAGAVAYGTGTAYAFTAAGTAGQVLTSNGAGAPTWAASGAGTITTTDFTATAGQTAFTVSYTPGLVSVYRNGIKLGNADYTATNSTSITLATACTVGELVEVQAFSSLSLATAVASFNGRTGAVSLTAADVTTALGTTPVQNANAVKNTGGWSVTPTGTKLVFDYNGTTVGSLDSSGNFIVIGNVTAFGTP